MLLNSSMKLNSRQTNWNNAFETLILINDGHWSDRRYLTSVSPDIRLTSTNGCQAHMQHNSCRSIARHQGHYVANFKDCIECNFLGHCIAHKVITKFLCKLVNCSCLFTWKNFVWSLSSFWMFKLSSWIQLDTMTLQIASSFSLHASWIKPTVLKHVPKLLQLLAAAEIKMVKRKHSKMKT